MTRFVKMPPGTLDRAGFLARYGGVYEHSPWIAGAVWDEGAASDGVATLAGAMRRGSRRRGKRCGWRCFAPTPISRASWRWRAN